MSPFFPSALEGKCTSGLRLTAPPIAWTMSHWPFPTCANSGLKPVHRAHVIWNLPQCAFPWSYSSHSLVLSLPSPSACSTLPVSPHSLNSLWPHFPFCCPIDLLSFTPFLWLLIPLLFAAHEATYSLSFLSISSFGFSFCNSFGFSLLFLLSLRPWTS